MTDDTVAYKVLLAAHRAANELDEIDGGAWIRLGGVSLGGAVRFEVHEAYGVDALDCPACRELHGEDLG